MPTLLRGPSAGIHERRSSPREAHPLPGDAVCESPEIRSQAEQTLNELLRQPDRFDAVAREMSNCPSGQHGGNLGQLGRGETVPEFERVLFRFGPTESFGNLSKRATAFTSSLLISISQATRCRSRRCMNGSPNGSRLGSKSAHCGSTFQFWPVTRKSWEWTCKVLRRRWCNDDVRMF